MKRGILIPVMVALALRIILFILVLNYNPSFLVQPDSPSYIKPAENLLRHGLFARGNFPNLEPETVRTPGYPIFIALSYLILGKRISSVIIFQIILGALFPLLVWKICEELELEERSKKVAVWLSAIDPLLLIYTVNVLTEELYAFLIALLVLFLLKLLKRRNFPLLILSSLVLGIQAYVRPIGVFLPFVVFISFGFMKRFKEGVILFLIAMLFIGGWVYRNYTETGALDFSSIAGANMLFYRAAYVLQLETGKSWLEVRRELGKELSSKTEGMGDAQRLAVARKMGLKIILFHPLSAIRAMFNGMVGTLAGAGGAYYLKAFGLAKRGSGLLSKLYELGFIDFIKLLLKERRAAFLINLAFGFYFLFVYIFSFLGFWKRKQDSKVWFLVIFILYFLIMSAGPESYSRFRVPFEAILLVLCGMGFERSEKKSRGCFSF